MKKFNIIFIILFLCICSSSCQNPKNEINKNLIEEAVKAICGKMCSPKEPNAICPIKRPPPDIEVFIMNKEDGIFSIHPEFSGKNMKAEPYIEIYNVLTSATTKGKWIKYTWNGKEKNAFIMLSDTGYIVGSEY